MKFFLVAVAIALQCCMAVSQTYTTRYDVLDLDQILSNKRLLSSYIKCMLEKGKCTAEGKELKSGLDEGQLSRKRKRRSLAHIAEALQNGCDKCTKAQREGIKKVIKHLITYEKDSWTQLVDKYDPQRVYTQKYENEFLI